MLFRSNAKNKFDKNAKIFLEHAKGYAPVGEISILIAVGSGHRDEAFKICRYILEEVKHQSPIWKKEHYADGKEEWLPGHSLRPKKEIEHNNPKNLIIFGENSAQAVLNTRKSYNELQGLTQEIKGIPTIVTFHPSELLSEPSLKEKLWEHLSLFKGIR